MSVFTPEIAEQLKYYVYRLIDPRNGETFYVGKGVQNRVFEHAKGELTAEEDKITDKLHRIRDIRLSGFEVAHVIHRHGMDEDTAFEVEAALIDAYPEVTNIMGGHYSDTRGVMHSQQIIECYKAQEAVFQHKVILISINRSATENNSVYEAVRLAWKLDPKKAAQAEYVLAVRQGLIVGIFVAEQWLAATPENFAGTIVQEGRWGFIGHEAPAHVAQLYLRHRLPASMRKKGAANPVRYAL